MAYIWVNPVSESMYDSKILTEFLQKHGYEQVKVTGDWADVVKEKYRMAVQEANSPVMDMRCPKIKGVLDEAGFTSNVTIPEIEPILIHCAREISGREDLQGAEKVITTPCQALADMGNALKLPNTTFVTWNQLLAMLGKSPEEHKRIKQLKESPIPPGFFKELGLKTISLAREEEIREYFQTRNSKEMIENIQLVEMLFCQQGCHNGDGL